MSQSTQSQFEQLSRALTADFSGGLSGGEVLLVNFSGENSSFVRLNHNQIRQAGQVAQAEVSMTLIASNRQASASQMLTGDAETDITAGHQLLGQLRELLPELPEDPYLNYAETVSDKSGAAATATCNEALTTIEPLLDDIHDAGRGLDLVGHLANGPIERGFANSMGAFYWHRAAGFNFDWSCYLDADKAVKAALAGQQWSKTRLDETMRKMRGSLKVMARPARTITPGQYRCYLAPAAMQEIFALLSWGGFGLKSQRSRQSPLNELVDGHRTLNSMVSLADVPAEGLAPAFTTRGFQKPARIDLISNGIYGESLVGPRSAKEFGPPVNCDYEAPTTLVMAGGSLREDDILTRLGTGLYISNLWYLNFSDRNHCRITGMTRFACFWVENGEILAPVNVMRFDDSIYDIFGPRLEALTDTPELMLDSNTYHARSLSSAKLPGALIDGLTFTL